MKKNIAYIEVDDLELWEAEAFKKGIKTQRTILAAPQFAESVYFKANLGDIFYCKKYKIHLEVTDPASEFKEIYYFTDQDALNEGIAAIYPHSNVGDDFFYLPDQIMAASALDCFKHHWNNQPGNKDYPFESNPFVITVGLKYVK